MFFGRQFIPQTLESGIDNFWERTQQFLDIGFRVGIKRPNMLIGGIPCCLLKLIFKFFHSFLYPPYIITNDEIRQFRVINTVDDVVPRFHCFLKLSYQLSSNESVATRASKFISSNSFEGAIWDYAHVVSDISPKRFVFLPCPSNHFGAYCDRRVCSSSSGLVPNSSFMSLGLSRV